MKEKEEESPSPIFSLGGRVGFDFEKRRLQIGEQRKLSWGKAGLNLLLSPITARGGLGLSFRDKNSIPLKNFSSKPLARFGRPGKFLFPLGERESIDVAYVDEKKNLELDEEYSYFADCNAVSFTSFSKNTSLGGLYFDEIPSLRILFPREAKVLSWQAAFSGEESVLSASVPFGQMSFDDSPINAVQFEGGCCLFIALYPGAVRLSAYAEKEGLLLEYGPAKEESRLSIPAGGVMESPTVLAFFADDLLSCGAMVRRFYEKRLPSPCPLKREDYLLLPRGMAYEEALSRSAEASRYGIDSIVLEEDDPSFDWASFFLTEKMALRSVVPAFTFRDNAIEVRAKIDAVLGYGPEAICLIFPDGACGGGIRQAVGRTAFLKELRKEMPDLPLLGIFPGEGFPRGGYLPYLSRVGGMVCAEPFQRAKQECASLLLSPGNRLLSPFDPERDPFTGRTASFEERESASAPFSRLFVPSSFKDKMKTLKKKEPVDIIPLGGLGKEDYVGFVLLGEEKQAEALLLKRGYNLPEKIPLPGLDPKCIYRVGDNGPYYVGERLLHDGLPLSDIPDFGLDLSWSVHTRSKWIPLCPQPSPDENA